MALRKRHAISYDDYKVNNEINNFLKNAKDRYCGREERRRSKTLEPTNQPQEAEEEEYADQQQESKD